MDGWVGVGGCVSHRRWFTWITISWGCSWQTCLFNTFQPNLTRRISSSLWMFVCMYGICVGKGVLKSQPYIFFGCMGKCVSESVCGCQLYPFCRSSLQRYIDGGACSTVELHHRTKRVEIRSEVKWCLLASNWQLWLVGWIADFFSTEAYKFN